jgi:hypothetical protein
MTISSRNEEIEVQINYMPSQVPGLVSDSARIPPTSLHSEFSALEGPTSVPSFCFVPIHVSP